MNFEQFLQIIWKQPAAGQDGFEGLVAKLLERLTGQRFHLSRSGDQGGRDMASNFLMAECKRYDDATKLKSDELLAKFTAAAQNSLKPDLWMVVTTKRLSDQHHNPLRQFSQDSGIAYFSIDAQGEEKSFLAALCAYAPEITVRHLQKYFADKQEADEFSSYLQSLKENKEVSDKSEKLKQELAAQNIGYDHWLEEQNAWLCGRLRNKDESKAAFSQNLAVRAEGEFFIPRKAAQEALDNWFANWHEQHKFFVVLGEEGDGKTWAVVDWLYGKLSDGFPVIFLPSGMADLKEFDILLPEILAKQLKEPYEGYWQKRLQRWLERPAGDTPLFLLVMDGLNERPDMEWRQLLAKFAVEPWCNRTAVLMTCRKKFWDEHLSSVGAAVFTLGPYNDAELKSALAVKNLTPDHFDKNLIDLLRIPRYFDLTVRLWERMDSEGEITRERLIYEDWRDKQERKLGNSLSHEAFQELICNLSNRIQQSKRIFRGELQTELSGYGDSNSLLTELSTGRVLQKHGSGWTINRDYLILGLGLLLAYEVADALEAQNNLAEVIAHFQEPQPDMDIKVSICAMALYHALGKKEWPEGIHLALFNAWVSGRNIKEDDWWRITSYLPVRPEIYLRMMEQEWSENANNMGLQNAFMSGFLKFGGQGTVQQILIPTFERWMGFVHHDGHKGRHARDDQSKLEKGRRDVRRALGHDFSADQCELFGFRLTRTEDEGLLRLSRFALAIISQQPRAPYIRAMITGVVAGMVMGYPDFYEQLSWVLRTAKDDIEKNILIEIEELLKNSQCVAQRTAVFLLRALGTETSWQMDKKIPSEYKEENLMYQLYKEYPCINLLYNWTREYYLECLGFLESSPANIDAIVSKLRDVAVDPSCTVPKKFKLLFMRTGKEIDLKYFKSNENGQTGEDIDIRNIEPALCSYCPERFSEIINELACLFPEREQSSRWLLSMFIYEHIMILSEKARSAVEEAWRSSLSEISGHNDAFFTETILFACVSRGKALNQQLDLIKERCSDDYTWCRGRFPFVKNIDDSSKLACVTEKLANIQMPSERLKFLINLLPSLLEIDQQIMELLPEFSEIDNRFARIHHALELFTCTKNKQGIQSILKSNWGSAKAGSDFERYWGSRLLAEHGLDLPFSEILERVSLQLLGYAVKKRDCKNDEIAAYGKTLHQLWHSVAMQPFEIPIEADQVAVKINLPEPEHECDYSLHTNDNLGFKIVSPTSIWGGSSYRSSGKDDEKETSFQDSMNFELQTSKNQQVKDKVNNFAVSLRKTGNNLFIEKFRIDALAEVVAACPEYVNQWLITALKQDTEMLVRCRGFYEALCEILLEHQPKQGERLFRRLHRENRLRLIDYTTEILNLLFGLFRAGNSETVCNLRKSLLDNALYDDELFEIAFLAQKHDRNEWLEGTITEYLQSDFALDNAKGLFLLGFMDDHSAGERLDAWIAEKKPSWLHDCARKAKIIHERNQWAHHWFERFITHEETLQAWAAFRLFLRCVDRRFWLWGEEMIYSPEVPYERFEHYRACRDSIMKATRKNEKNHFKLQENLVGCKVQENQLWPWLRAYLSEEDAQQA
ncbi:MAG: hypothetical protein CDV28_10229 [Candidatus Electronema aureum]|uniref:NACHT domain-containing protein n=1 Tax=Candidatus Electronema aureum TaxID=2005002 RepID=A0A521G4F5_9BACT|nr:MAG: hypothetical protein CDV28_10229 [Candidatus Electronema aureum]